MGGNGSKERPPVPLNVNYFGILFGRRRIGLVLAPVEIISATKSILSNYFKIIDSFEKEQFTQYLLNGEPFAPSSKKDILTKEFMCTLLKTYYSLGWRCKVASDLKRRVGGSNTLIFQKTVAKATNVICLSLRKDNKLGVFATDDVVSTVRQTVSTHWPFRIIKEKTLENCREFTLNGFPWSSFSADEFNSYYTTSLVTSLVRSLYRSGWVLIGGIKASKKPSDLNALYFYHDPSVISKPTQFLSMSLNKDNEIRFFNLPAELIVPVRSAIAENWSKGTDEERTENGAYIFELSGSAWDAEELETVDARRIISGILNALRRFNWNVYTTCKSTVSVTVKSMFIFHNDPALALPFQPISCISLNEWNKVRVIDGNQQILDAVRGAILAGWSIGIKGEGEYGRSWEFTLNGNPFGENQVNMVISMILVMNYIEGLGLKFLCSADVSGRIFNTNNNSYPVDLSTWYFSF